MLEKSYITTLVDFKVWVKGIKSDKLSLDTETTDTNYYKLDIMGFSFCDGQRACYVNVWENPERDSILDFLRDSLAWQPAFQKLIFHGAPFDLKVLHKIGCKRITPNIFCTMTAAHLINENMKKGLKCLAKKYLDVKEPLTYAQASRYGFSSPEFINYATNDAIWTWKLHEIFNRKLQQQKLDKLFHEIEMPFQFVLMDLAINGVLIDRIEFDIIAQKVVKDISDMEFQLRDAAGIPYQKQGNLFTEEMEVLSGVNMNSSDQLVKIVTEKLGLEITERTKGSKPKPSIAKATRMRLKNEHPFIEILDRYKTAINLHQKFMRPFPAYINSDGRVRAGFHNTVAVTGRMSVSKPPLHQLPKINEDYPVDFRGTIIAPPGKSILACDYDGQELRGLTQVSKDSGLIECFNNGKDVHLETTNEIFKLNIPDKELYKTHKKFKKHKKNFKVKRDEAKNCVVFPIIYGTTAYGVSKSLNISEEEAQGFIDGFLDLYPDVRRAIERCSNFLRNHKYVYTFTGRRRRLYDLTPKAYRQAFNFLIQGYCADMIRLASTNVRNLGLKHPEWGLKIILIVHDELVLEIKDEYIEEARPLVKEAMESAVKLVIPLIVEIGVGKKYSDAK